MANKTRKIEIFSAGCSVCDDVVRQIQEAACTSCDIQVLDMKTTDIRNRAADLGIKSIPAVVIDGKLADCCANRSFDLKALRSAGLGQTVS